MDVHRAMVTRLGDDPDLLDRLADAVAPARASGVRVVHVRVALRPGFPEVSPDNRRPATLAASGDRHGEDDDGTQLHPAVEPAPGIATWGVVLSTLRLSTLRQAADRDYRLVVLSDGCADTDPQVHPVLTEKSFTRQVEVTTVAGWTASLEG
jgi:nicotinamidase-related amidase